jgi:hypothetical protein
MNVRLVNINPNAGGAAEVIYNYGEEKFSEGFWSGVIYSALGFIFLFCLRELYRSRR